MMPLIAASKDRGFTPLYLETDIGARIIVARDIHRPQGNMKALVTDSLAMLGGTHAAAALDQQVGKLHQAHQYTALPEDARVFDVGIRTVDAVFRAYEENIGNSYSGATLLARAPLGVEHPGGYSWAPKQWPFDLIALPGLTSEALDEWTAGRVQLK